METVSENNKGNKGKRGRPRKYARAGGDLEEFGRYESDPTRGITEKMFFTTRQQQNIILAERAKDRLRRFAEDMPEGHFALEDGVWTCLTPRAWLTADGADDPPQRVLTELGRCLELSEDLYWGALDWYAGEVHESPYRRRAEDVAKVIRAVRLGKRIAPPGN
jgi:hypothetical protein